MHTGLVSANYISPTLDYSEADALCQAIIERYKADEIDEQKARHQIAELLEKTRVAWIAANEFNRTYTTQVRSDLGIEMSALLYTKVMQSDGHGLVFEKAEGASVAGWARSLLRSANISLLRKVKPPVIVDPTEGFHPTVAPAQMRQPFKNTEKEHAGYETAMDWFSSRSRQLRDNSRIQAAYQSVMFSLDVPPLVRPEYKERMRLRRMFDEDPSVGYQSACVVRAIHDRTFGSTKIDEGFLALWDDFPYDEIDRVVSRDENFAQTLVLGALADKPRPIRTIVRDFRLEVRSYGEGRGWRAKSDELCEAYFALEFEAYSSFDARGVAKHKMLVAGQALTRARAKNTIDLAIAHEGQRLGETPEEVFEKLDEIMGRLNDRPVEPVAVECEDIEEDDTDVEPDAPEAEEFDDDGF